MRFSSQNDVVTLTRKVVFEKNVALQDEVNMSLKIGLGLNIKTVNLNLEPQ